MLGSKTLIILGRLNLITFNLIKLISFFWLFSGGQNAVTCSRDHEIHTIWSPIYQCLVCVCVQEGWTLRPICVSCNSCATKPTPKPLPSPPPSIVIPPPPPPPLIPESQGKILRISFSFMNFL